MANHTTIRLEADKKEEFVKLCDKMGLSVSGAINIFVTKVLQCRRIPFDISADADPFFSDVNQRFLLESIAQLERGEKQARLGSWEGRGWIADDFNEPMDAYGRFAHDPNYGTPKEEAWEK